jgi:hypothetical protein
MGLAVVAVGFVVTDAFLGMAPGPTEANAKRVKPGMKMHEVEAILGDLGNGVLRVAGVYRLLTTGTGRGASFGSGSVGGCSMGAHAS